MNTRKIGVVMLALLLAAMAMVPMVSAANQKIHLVDWSNVAPTKPLDQSELITFIISDKILQDTNVQNNPSLIRLNISEFTTTITQNELIDCPNCNIQKHLNTDENIAVLSIPKTMFDSFKQDANGSSITLPKEFFKTYSSVREFSKQRMSTFNNR
jgi:nitrate reductase cytochrome c-type subunit